MKRDWKKTKAVNKLKKHKASEQATNIRWHGNQRLRRSSIYEAEKQQQLLQGSYRFEGYRRTVPVVSIQRPIRLKHRNP